VNFLPLRSPLDSKSDLRSIINKLEGQIIKQIKLSMNFFSQDKFPPDIYKLSNFLLQNKQFVVINVGAFLVAQDLRGKIF
jgi:hypothetical protein